MDVQRGALLLALSMLGCGSAFNIEVMQTSGLPGSEALWFYDADHLIRCEYQRGGETMGCARVMRVKEVPRRLAGGELVAPGGSKGAATHMDVLWIREGERLHRCSAQVSEPATCALVKTFDEPVQSLAAFTTKVEEATVRFAVWVLDGDKRIHRCAGGEAPACVPLPAAR